MLSALETGVNWRQITGANNGYLTNDTKRCGPHGDKWWALDAYANTSDLIGREEQCSEKTNYKQFRCVCIADNDATTGLRVTVNGTVRNEIHNQVCTACARPLTRAGQNRNTVVTYFLISWNEISEVLLSEFGNQKYRNRYVIWLQVHLFKFRGICERIVTDS